MIISVSEYCPFGMMMRQSNASKYRYGFNNKENDNEVKGIGNQIDYGARVYDARAGRFLSVDPLQKEYPELTPYQFSHNSPIDGIDLDGLERVDYRLTFGNEGKPKLEYLGTGPTEKRSNIFWKTEIPKHIRLEYNGEHYIFTDEKNLAYGEDSKRLSIQGTLGQELYNMNDFDQFLRNPDPDLYGSHEDAKKAFFRELTVRRAIALTAEAGNRYGAVSARRITSNKSTNSAPEQQATGAHSGNKETATASSNATATFTYEGQEYEIKANVPYKRPTNATTSAQSKAVNQTNAQCATCGTTQGPFNADHKTPLSVEHLSTGSIDKNKIHSTSTVQSQCKDCSNKQGGELRKVTGKANKIIKERQNEQQQSKQN